MSDVCRRCCGCYKGKENETTRTWIKVGKIKKPNHVNYIQAATMQ